jgi:hypothetical protein
MRKFSRFPFIKGLRIDVIDTVRGQSLGYAADVSLGGLRLIGEEPLVAGEEYQLQLNIPANRVLPPQEIPIQVVVQWSRKNFRRGYEQGLKLTEPSRAFENLVKSLSHTLGLSDTSLPRRR